MRGTPRTGWIGGGCSTSLLAFSKCLPLLLVLLVSLACGPGDAGSPPSTADSIAFPASESAADSEPTSDPLSVSVSSRIVRPGALVEVRVGGSPPESWVELGLGPPRSEYEILDSLASNSGGAGTAALTVPPYDRSGRPYLVVARVATGPGAREAFSEPFLVLEHDDTVTVRGSLTGESGSCPILRTPLGVRYGLQADGGEVPEGGGELEIRGVLPDIPGCSEGIPLRVVAASRR